MKNPHLEREIARIEKQRLLRDAEHRHRMQRWSQRIHDALWVAIAGLMGAKLMHTTVCNLN